MEVQNNFCSECGTKINKNDKFCQNCGKHFSTGAMKSMFSIIGEIILFLIISSIFVIPCAKAVIEDLYHYVLRGNGIFLGLAVGFSAGLLFIFALWSVIKFNRLEKRIIELQEKLNKE